MKKTFLGLLLALTAVSFAGCGPCEEDVLTNLGDTVATIGKSGLAKDQILVERKAGRAAKCAEQKAGEMKKKMGF
jgi:hypothetical protein